MKTEAVLVFCATLALLVVVTGGTFSHGNSKDLYKVLNAIKDKYKDYYNSYNKGGKSSDSSDSKSKDSDSKRKYGDSKSKDSDSKSKDSKSKDSDSRSKDKDGNKCTGKTEYKTCESWKFELKKCYISEGTVKSVQLFKQESKTECKFGKSWGYKDNYVWVNGCCRGKFQICLEDEDKCKGKTEYKTCESWKFELKKCYISEGTVKSVQLFKQESKTECKFGKSWGYKDNYVWVNGCCRGKFQICLEDEDKCKGKTEYKTCESWKFELKKCYISEGTVKSVQLFKQESKTECKFGKSWGYKDNYVWVNGFCRGKFQICREDEDKCKGKTEYKTCDSWKFELKKCYISEGTVKSVQLFKQESKTECKFGKSWGYKDNYVWVNGCCRGKFQICLEEDKCDGEIVYKKCESWQFKYKKYWFDDGTIKYVKLVDQESDTTCIQNKNWGYGKNFIWVDKGCRAKFRLCVDEKDKCDGEIVYRKCESWQFKYKKCWFDDGTIKYVKLFDQESDTTCIQNKNWGYGKNFIWVNKGCRAKFQLCVDDNIDQAQIYKFL